jgi:succinyl-diaminopimelate desuccinylase
MKDTETLFSRIDGMTDLVIEWQRGLVGIPAIAPESEGAGEKEKSEWVKKALAAFHPDEVREYNAPDNRVPCGYRPNMLVRWYGKDNSKTAWVMAHLDVVPPGNLSEWNTDPYQVVVEGDKMYGRGTEDNHQGLVSALVAIRAILDMGAQPACNMGLAIVADEETGSEYGLRYMMEHHKEAFGADDLIIVPDAGDEAGLTIEIAEKSILWLKIEITGKLCHASTPALGINAHRAAAHLAVKLDSLYDHFNLSNELFDPPISTFEPTKKEIDVRNINSVPGKDTFYFDSRVLPEYPLSMVEEKISSLCKEIEDRFGVSIATKAMQRAEAAPPTTADAQVVRSLQRGIAAVKGSEAKLIGIGGGTVAAVFRAAALPAAVWSTLHDTAHQANEYSLISNALSDAKVMAHVFMGY